MENDLLTLMFRNANGHVFAEIDQAIAKLQAAREAPLSSDQQLLEALQHVTRCGIFIQALKLSAETVAARMPWTVSAH